ncbi:hypothetical protein, partial [Microcoleus sp. POL10_C6]|uniref:hypothetical protein n=1 Tax=Microcoleus sp. POL10_C6 TaxID=2818852 RepID=UPI002FD43CBC
SCTLLSIARSLNPAHVICARYIQQAPIIYASRSPAQNAHSSQKSWCDTLAGAKGGINFSVRFFL